METCGLEASSGVRRYNHFNALVERHARQFEATETTSPTILLGKLKRAAPYMGIEPEVVALMDKLCSHSRKQDWKPGRTPIVWPSNEDLMLALAKSKRTVQNRIRRAIEIGLLVPRDSPNGHRGGRRDAKGDILWAYGFDLRPLGTRAEEFDAVAEQGVANDKEIKRLRGVITAARRRALMLAQAVEANVLEVVNTIPTLEIVRMAVAHIRGSRDLLQLARCATQVTKHVDQLQSAVDEALEAQVTALDAGHGNTLEPSNIAPSGSADSAHSTTTIKTETAYAVTSRGYPGKSSGAADTLGSYSQSETEADLDQHGVDPGFIARACPDIIWELDLGPRAWGRLVSMAEQMTGQHNISPHAWREACRLMGQRGAAAAVIATVSKTLNRHVRNPGAYLRGLSQRAASGELHLGKTFHGLREMAAITQRA